MFTVSAPEQQWLGQVEVSNLKQAIKTKYAWQVNQKGCHAIITDLNGFVISSREIAQYISTDFFQTTPV